jgi:CRISPR/Cas system-associated exonuclease Cas4 (RecB family)
MQAKFQYVERQPQVQNAAASFGTAVHLAIELYNNTENDVKAAEECFLFVWDNPEQFGIAPVMWFPRTSYGAYRERGIEFIRKYHENHQWLDREIIATEHKFCVDFRGGHKISGIVDIIETFAGSEELRITDLKTGQRPNARNLGFDVQFTAYCYAAQQEQFWLGYEPEIEKYPALPNGAELYERFKDYTVVGIWSDLKAAKDYPVGPRTEDDYSKLHRCLDEIEKAIKLEVYVPDISGDTCGICSYTDLCPVYSPPDTAKEIDGSF